jgi:TolB protein
MGRAVGRLAGQIGLALLLIGALASGAGVLIGRAVPHRPWLTYTAAYPDGIGDIIFYDLGRDLAYNLTRTPDLDESRSVWSPDGERVAFECDQGERRVTVLCFASVESPPHPASLGGCEWLYRPRWSPDGSHISYVARSSNPMIGGFALRTAAYPALLALGECVELPLGGIDSAMHSSWSPDGAQLAFASFSRTASRIWTADSDGAARAHELPQLVGSNFQPAWSPDGTRIAFVTSVQGYKQRLALLEVRTGAVRELTDGGGIGNDFYPVWSPDGARLAFLSDRDGADFDVFVLDMATEALRQITDNYFLDDNPAWSPDGTQIAVMSNRDGGFHIYTIDVESRASRRITYGVGAHNFPSWRP